MEWAKQWALLIRLRAQAEAELGAEAFQAAAARGAQLPMTELVREARIFWENT